MRTVTDFQNTSGKRYSEECDMKWSIVQRAKPYSDVSKRCDLCTAKKLKIIDEDKSVSGS